LWDGSRRAAGKTGALTKALNCCSVGGAARRLKGCLETINSVPVYLFCLLRSLIPGRASCVSVCCCRHCDVIFNMSYKCIQMGDNPNHNFTSFDNFLWSMLTTFQLITLDYWEDVYNKVSCKNKNLCHIFSL
jgi:Ion transport protein